MPAGQVFEKRRVPKHDENLLVSTGQPAAKPLDAVDEFLTRLVRLELLTLRVIRSVLLVVPPDVARKPRQSPGEERKFVDENTLAPTDITRRAQLLREMMADEHLVAPRHHLSLVEIAIARRSPVGIRRELTEIRPDGSQGLASWRRGPLLSVAVG